MGAAGRIPPFLFLSPHEHHAKLRELLPGCRCNPPTHGCPAPPVRPGTALRGRCWLAPAQITAWAGINGLGHSGPQRSRHYTLTSCPVEQRFLPAKINSPQSKLGARPGGAGAARSLPPSPPLPRGRPRVHTPGLCLPLGPARWAKASGGLELRAGAEHRQGGPGAPEAGISREGGLGKARWFALGHQ